MPDPRPSSTIGVSEPAGIGPSESIPDDIVLAAKQPAAVAFGAVRRKARVPPKQQISPNYPDAPSPSLLENPTVGCLSAERISVSRAKTVCAVEFSGNRAANAA